MTQNIHGQYQSVEDSGKKARAGVPKLLRFDRVVVRVALVKLCPYQVVVMSNHSSYHHNWDGENWGVADRCESFTCWA